ncbi:hypothetical protein CONCODRAFT_10915, partial [Conidiobolus coronatus NRRL 28638]
MTLKFTEYEELYQSAYPYNIVAAGYGIADSIIVLILGASLLISIIKTNNEGWKIDMKLCAMLLGVDLACTLLILFYNLQYLFYSNTYLEGHALCNLNGALVNILFPTAVFLMAVISLERCLLIVFKREFSLMFYFCIFATFSMINAANVAQTVINNGYIAYPLAIYCQYNTSQTAGLVGSVVMVLVGGISYNMIILSYLAICFYRRSQSLKAQLELGLDPIKVKKEVNSTIIKSLIIMLGSILSTGIFVVITAISWF